MCKNFLFIGILVAFWAQDCEGSNKSAKNDDYLMPEKEISVRGIVTREDKNVLRYCTVKNVYLNTGEIFSGTLWMDGGKPHTSQPKKFYFLEVGDTVVYRPSFKEENFFRKEVKQDPKILEIHFQKKR